MIMLTKVKVRMTHFPRVISFVDEYSSYDRSTLSLAMHVAAALELNRFVTSGIKTSSWCVEKEVR